MRVTLVPSAVAPAEAAEVQYLTSYVIDDTLAIDAGCLGLYKTPREQARIKHILISHSHLDHVASLPLFLENVYEPTPECVTIHGAEPVLDSLRRDLFNGRVWPDFIGYSEKNPPFLKLATLESGRPLDLDGHRITPVAVNHAVPTMGFLVESGASAIVISSDTGATDEIWRRANKLPNLKAVFLEVSFPNALAEVAERVKHLTPASFARELGKLERPVPVYVMHIKSRFRPQVVQELTALALPNVRLARFGVEYEF